MYKRNVGKFRHKIELLKPTKRARDEYGGLTSVEYIPQTAVFAMCETRNQSRQNIISDYVTVDTRYFVVRDLRTVVPELDLSWRIRHNGRVYILNDILLIDESVPYYLQLTATAINGSGGVD